MLARARDGGRFGGEGKPGDDGVTMGGAIAGGVIAVPEALKGAVDVLLIADAGDITGSGAQAFKALGKEAAKMSAAALRSLVAHEARAACERELRATIERLASKPKWRALTAEERQRAVRIAYYELQRRFFRGSHGLGPVAEGSICVLVGLGGYLSATPRPCRRIRHDRRGPLPGRVAAAT